MYAVLHGFGHGVFVRALRAHPPVATKYSACTPVLPDSIRVVARTQVLAATAMCAKAPWLQLAYVCADGAYMSYGEFVDQTFVTFQEAVRACDEVSLAAPCFNRVIEFWGFSYLDTPSGMKTYWNHSAHKQIVTFAQCSSSTFATHEASRRAVSYTHLTLPTIYSV